MWDVVTGKWWKLHNEELSGTYVHQILLGYWNREERLGRGM